MSLTQEKRPILFNIKSELKIRPLARCFLCPPPYTNARTANGGAASGWQSKECNSGGGALSASGRRTDAEQAGVTEGIRGRTRSERVHVRPTSTSCLPLRIPLSPRHRLSFLAHFRPSLRSQDSSGERVLDRIRRDKCVRVKNF